MHRAATLLALMIATTASAAWAAYSSLPMDDLTRPDPGARPADIVIRVPPEDVARCRATLVQVMSMPVDPEHVTAISAHMPQGPAVRCEAEGGK